eukprot:2426078-Rhodomonas_salina.1
MSGFPASGLRPAYGQAFRLSGFPAYRLRPAYPWLLCPEDQSSPLTTIHPDRNPGEKTRFWAMLGALLEHPRARRNRPH